jgi:DNA adenine methylase
MADQHYSPLRYPGGKASLFDFLVKTLEYNDINYGKYVEGFAGGAGAALKLLMLEHVGDVYLNDKDIFIYKFWKAVVNETEELNRLIYDAEISTEKWRYRNRILNDPTLQSNISDLEMGFTCFFLNRCNRSGILASGPIGGLEQNGDWKIDARFNKEALIKRIEKIALYKDRIHLYNLDIVKFLKIIRDKSFRQEDVLLYLDPPYVEQGDQLYRHYFNVEDHQRLAKHLQSFEKHNWIVSYDDNELIHRIYKEVTRNIFEFNYFANRTKVGRELVITSKQFVLPDTYTHYSKTKLIENNQYQANAM